MSTFNTADMTVFFSDFAVTVTATTWDTTFSAIFDKEWVEFAEVSTEAPQFLMKSSDLPATYASGDAFTIESVNYQLVDVQYAEPGLHRVILALV